MSVKVQLVSVSESKVAVDDGSALSVASLPVFGLSLTSINGVSNRTLRVVVPSGLTEIECRETIPEWAWKREKDKDVRRLKLMVEKDTVSGLAAVTT